MQERDKNGGEREGGRERNEEMEIYTREIEKLRVTWMRERERKNDREKERGGKKRGDRGWKKREKIRNEILATRTKQSCLPEERVTKKIKGEVDYRRETKIKGGETETETERETERVSRPESVFTKIENNNE